MIDVFPNEDHHLKHENIKNPLEETPCYICGRGIREPWKNTVRVFYGFTLVTEEEAQQLDPNGDLGVWPIGPDCLKRHPEIKPYLIRRLS